MILNLLGMGVLSHSVTFRYIIGDKHGETAENEKKGPRASTGR